MRRIVLGMAAAVTLSTAMVGNAQASWLSHLFAPRRPQPTYVVVAAPPICEQPRHHGHGNWQGPRVAPPRSQTFQSGYRGYPAPNYGGIRY